MIADLLSSPVQAGLKFKIFSSVKEISPHEWNRLTDHLAPMMEWEYFYILEESRCVGEERRYQPFHIALVDRKDNIIAIAPFFERTDSAFEFGISGLMAEVSAITRIPFEKGLVGTIPFTPVPAYSFLTPTRNSKDLQHIVRLFLRYIDYLCEIYGFMSVRLYFVDPLLNEMQPLLAQFGYVQLITQHFMWHNHYASFEEFLRSLGSHKRRNVRRELRKLNEMGIHISMQPGSRVDEKIFDQMYGLYLRTWKKHMPPWIRPYLNRQFFILLRPFFRDRCAFSIATRGSDTKGMAIFFEKNEKLYGRYWGSFEHVPYLHFATCYYIPFMYAIEKGIKMFDPGFGGYHKEIRGFEYVPAYHFVKFFGPSRHLGYMALENVVTRNYEI